MFKYVLTILAFVGFFLLPNLSDAHRKNDVQKDGCHKSANDDSYHCHSANETITFESQRAGYYKIKKMVDGDTFNLTYGEKTMKVRLYGIDTPETKKGRKLTADVKAILKERGITEGDDGYTDALEDEKVRQMDLGEKSKDYVKDRLQGKDVFFLFDTTETFPFVAQGGYNRILTYVFYEEDGVTHFLNIDLIVHGHADLDYIEDPFRYRWAFVSDDLGKIQEMFRKHPLPEMNASNTRPVQSEGLVGIWEEIKRQ